MTIAPGLEDVGDVLNDLNRRLEGVEQELTSPDVMTGPITNEFPGLIIDGEEVDVRIPEEVGDLELTTGAFMDDIWIDAEWPSSELATAYEVLVAEKVGDVYNLPEVFSVTPNNFRITNRKPATEYGVRVYAISQLGRRSEGFPAADEYQDITTGADTSIPGPLTGFEMTAGMSSLMLSWNKATEKDVNLYRFQIDTVDTFDSPDLRDEYSSATIVAFTDLPPATLYYGRAKPYDESGNEGPWTATASMETGQTFELGPGVVLREHLADLAVDLSKLANDAVAAEKIQAGAVTALKIGAGAVTTEKLFAGAVTTEKLFAGAVSADKIAAGAITADKINAAGISAGSITFGQMHGDRIQANTISVGALTSGTIYSTTIVLGSGGSIQAGDSTNGVVFNSLGLRAYQGGVEKFILDSSGAATFKGNIDGATITGGTITLATNRIHLSNAGIRFFNSPGGWDPTSGLRWVDGTYGWDIGYFFCDTDTMYLQTPGSQAKIEYRSNWHKWTSPSGATTIMEYSSGIDAFIISKPVWMQGQFDLMSQNFYAWSLYQSGASGNNLVGFMPSSGRIYNHVSSERFKTNIAPITGTDVIFDFEYVEYDPVQPEEKEKYEKARKAGKRATPKKDGSRSHGVIAEDVEKLLKQRKIDPERYCSYDADGKVISVNYLNLIAPLVHEVKLLRDRVSQLEKGRK